MVKYLVCCQVFWVDLRCLQGQRQPIWTLVFYCCISNNLLREENCCCLTCLTCFLIFRFSISFSMFFLLSCLAIFGWLASFFRFFFGYWGEYSAVIEKNSSSNNKTCNKKAVTKIFRISNSKGPPWNLVKFRIEIFLVNVPRIMCWFFIVLIVN